MKKGPVGNQGDKRIRDRVRGKSGEGPFPGRMRGRGNL